MPAAFFGHGNPMNAWRSTANTADWARTGGGYDWAQLAATEQARRTETAPRPHRDRAGAPAAQPVDLRAATPTRPPGSR